MAHTIQDAPHQVPYTRRWWRYDVNVPIRVIVQNATKTAIFHGRAFSLSNGGMAMFASAELKPGDEMAVEFTPPYSLPPLRVEARICNRAGYNYGAEFMAESIRQRRDVAQFCQLLSTLVASCIQE